VQCLDCGADLVEARRKEREQLQEQSVAGRTGSSEETKVAIRSAAAAGRALPGESSKETRLKIFDKQEAEARKQEVGAALVLAVIALGAGLALLGVGLSRMSSIGWGEVFSLRLPDLRSLGGLVDSRLVAIVLVGLGLGGVLVGVGMLIRRGLALAAVRSVEAGEKPEIVGLNAPLQIGLLLVAVFCPVAGLVLGIILRLSKDSDVAGFGGMMIWISLGVIALLAINMLYGLLAEVATRRAPNPGGNIIKDTQG
jgi:hypothetical protein